jgi:hypothetical protein
MEMFRNSVTLTAIHPHQRLSEMALSSHFKYIVGNIFKELMAIKSVEYKTKSSKSNKPVPTAFTHAGIYGESK